MPEPVLAMLLLTRRGLPILPFLSSTLPSPHPLLFTKFSTKTTAAQDNSPPNPRFLEGYLISKLGFSQNQAISASQKLPKSQTIKNPDAVVSFFEQKGWDRTQIECLLLKNPKLLCFSIENKLGPNFKDLHDTGMSAMEIIQLITDCPLMLGANDLLSKIAFFRTLLGSNAKVLQANKNDTALMTSRLDKKIIPNISLLRETGLTDHMIEKVILTSRMITRRNASILESIVQTKELGVSCTSGMFIHIVITLSMISKSKYITKMSLLKSLGWSDDDISKTIKKHPRLLWHREEKIRQKLDFLLGVGMELSYIIRNPVFLSYSLEKRLVPRHNVLMHLVSKELFPKGFNRFWNFFNLTEEKFLQKFVMPFNDEVPGIYESCSLILAGKVAT